jgi:exo-1,4-beta-D-glucosaminidase
MLSSGWYSLHWQVFDCFLRPSAAYFGVKKSAEPLHIQWDYGFQNNVTVVNDSYQSYTGLTATADVLNFDLSNKYHNAVTVAAGPASPVVAFTIPAISTLSTTYFLKLRLQDSTGKVVSDNFYWYSTTHDALKSSCKWYVCLASKYADFTALQTMPLVTVCHTVAFSGDTATVTLTNSSTSLAPFDPREGHGRRTGSSSCILERQLHFAITGRKPRGNGEFRDGGIADRLHRAGGRVQRDSELSGRCGESRPSFR